MPMRISARSLCLTGIWLLIAIFVVAVGARLVERRTPPSKVSRIEDAGEDSSRDASAGRIALFHDRVLVPIDSSNQRICASKGQLRWKRMLRGVSRMSPCATAGSDTIVAAGAVDDLGDSGPPIQSRAVMIALDREGNDLWQIVAEPIEPGATAGVIAMAGDSSSDLVAVVAISGSTKFGPFLLLAPAGEPNVCLLKLNRSGLGKWSTCLPADGRATSGFGAVAIDSMGAIVFSGSVDEHGHACGSVVADAGLFSGFVAKMSSSGVSMWCHVFPDFRVNSVTILESDAILAAGSIGLNEASSVRVMSFDPDGVERWDRRFSGTGMAIGRAAPTGGFYLAGSFSDHLVFGGRVPPLHVARGRYIRMHDAYLAEFDHLGRVQWARSFGDNAAQTAEGLQAFRDAMVLAVYSCGAVNFGGQTFGHSNLNLRLSDLAFEDTAPECHSYLAEFDSLGSHVFSAEVGTSEMPTALAMTRDQSMVLVGDAYGVGDRRGFVASYCW